MKVRGELNSKSVRPTDNVWLSTFIGYKSSMIIENLFRIIIRNDSLQPRVILGLIYVAVLSVCFRSLETP